ncbi:hypothetical protein [Rummeliibacillus sp. POC4]|uniref:hypothetical protein n=1 Tax=Rummeliibacillus sp. POC4 TaxID=2305899 RepID=UPI000E670E3B|nr:hypothetical protein [Rummeliibacillus sp. POC4]RIJ65317.1 hypothetical protein D1606_08320 [Rummeliibacillus sp. POC4]
MYQGDTIRLKVHFKNFNGQSIDPSDIKLTIYKSDKTKIEQFILDDSNKENVGVYFYDFVPIGLSEFVYEFSGLYNNKPILARDKVQIKFI